MKKPSQYLEMEISSRCIIEVKAVSKVTGALGMVKQTKQKSMIVIAGKTKLQMTITKRKILAHILHDHYSLIAQFK